MSPRLALVVVGLSFATLGCDTRVDLGELPPCDVTTCPDGCCHEGECYPFARQDVSRCGSSGQDCRFCPGGDEAACHEGQCHRSLCGECAGCCDGIFCMPGTNTLACGRFGQACNDCGSDEQCNSGVCTKCGPHNCNGCCDTFGECLAGTTDFDCGRGGEACRMCEGFTSCVGNACQ